MFKTKCLYFALMQWMLKTSFVSDYVGISKQGWKFVMLKSQFWPYIIFGLFDILSKLLHENEFCQLRFVS